MALADQSITHQRCTEVDSIIAELATLRINIQVLHTRVDFSVAIYFLRELTTGSCSCCRGSVLKFTRLAYGLIRSTACLNSKTTLLLQAIGMRGFNLASCEHEATLFTTLRCLRIHKHWWERKCKFYHLWMVENSSRQNRSLHTLLASFLHLPTSASLLCDTVCVQVCRLMPPRASHKCWSTIEVVSQIIYMYPVCSWLLSVFNNNLGGDKIYSAAVVYINSGINFPQIV